MRTRTLVILLIAVTALVPLGTDGSTAGAAPRWAPAASATIRPGVQVVAAGQQCTANFVFTDPSGGVYLGQAAHCTSLGDANDTDGCSTPSMPLGTPVQIGGASRPGRLVYNSWINMQATRTRDVNACAYNDFALVKVDPHDVGRVNPSVPHFGGPTGLAPLRAQGPGRKVYSYGNSGLRFGLRATSPKYGVSLGSSGAGWTYDVYTASPGIPGDSGSGFLDAGGRAFGVLSTLQVYPFAGSNGVTDLTAALQYLYGRTGARITLARGTQPFRPAV